MSNTIGHEPGGMEKVIPILLGVMFGLALLYIALSNTNQANYQDKQPCEYFKQEKLSDVPARCVTPQGGFK